MIRRYSLLMMLILLAILPAAMAADPGQLPHQFAPYYQNEDDGPVSMTLDSQGTMWAVWSYANGLEEDLAICRSIGNTWSPPSLLGVLNGRDDLDPRLSFTQEGIPVLAWWQPGDGENLRDRVLLSFLVDGEWTRPAQYSDPALNGRQPNFFDSGIDLTVGFLQIDPGTGESGISIAPVKLPEPGGGTNGPDPVPTFTVDGEQEMPPNTGGNSQSP